MDCLSGSLIVGEYQERIGVAQIVDEGPENLISGTVYNFLIRDDANEAARSVPGEDRVVSAIWIEE
jgi:hypothetical protein